MQQEPTTHKLAHSQADSKRRHEHPAMQDISSILQTQTPNAQVVYNRNVRIQTIKVEPLVLVHRPLEHIRHVSVAGGMSRSISSVLLFGVEVK